jgi:hypothetical protein
VRVAGINYFNKIENSKDISNTTVCETSELTTYSSSLPGFKDTGKISPLGDDDTLKKAYPGIFNQKERSTQIQHK